MSIFKDPQGPAQKSFEEYSEELEQNGWVTIPKGTLVSLTYGVDEGIYIQYLPTPFFVTLKSDLFAEPTVVNHTTRRMRGFRIVSKELIEAMDSPSGGSKFHFRGGSSDEHTKRIRDISLELNREFLEEYGLGLEYRGFPIVSVLMDIQQEEII